MQIKFRPSPAHPEYRNFKKDCDQLRDSMYPGKTYKGNWTLFRKAIIIGASWLTLYTVNVFFIIPTPVTVILLILQGFFTAMIGFNIMHDGGHSSFSKYKWLNNFMVLTLNFLGGNAALWKIKHNTVHHTATNIAEHDDDIELGVLARFNPAQKWYFFHRLQAVYVPLFLYPLGYLSWIYLLDVKKYFYKKIATHSFAFTPKEHALFWLSKILHVCIFVVVPSLSHPFISVLIGYGILVFTTGMCISLIFQLAHVVMQTQMIQTKIIGGYEVIENTNKIHQVLTTANFATNSRFWTWVCGGLNFQIEHHLFPEVSHVHYRNMQPKVKELFKKYGLTYNENATFLKAVWSHFQTLWLYGKKSTHLPA